MRRLRRPFGRLHWRLALSYILVTLVVALLVEVVNTVTAIAAAQSTQKSNQTNYFAKTLDDLFAPQLVPYLEQKPPDQQGLAAWVTTLLFPTSHPQGGKNTNADYAGPFSSQFTLVAVLDPTGQVLASASVNGAPAQGSISTPQAQAIIDSALAGDQMPADQTGTLADGRTVVAVPVVAPDGQQVLGVLFTIPEGQVLTYTGKPSDTLAIVLTTIKPDALYFILLACVVGTLSGLWALRGITRRLRRITQAADAWSRGEFQVEVRDASRDEVGYLARDLNTMAEQLQTLLTTRQELAVVEERHRLARDLHDSVKQQMFVITMLLGTARAQVTDHPQAEQTLLEAERLAGQAQQELTALIRALRPVALAGKGLSAALQELLDEWSQHTGIKAAANLSDDLPLSLEAEQACFRMAQEALSNVARHSGATQVTARLFREAEVTVLQIEDNGHGFDLIQSKGLGLGLNSMRERVESVGGSLLIFSAADGTRVEGRLPQAHTLPPAVTGDASPSARVVSA
jgi:NarL family two-component system sensor histidine kinase LiaS